MSSTYKIFAVVFLLSYVFVGSQTAYASVARHTHSTSTNPSHTKRISTKDDALAFFRNGVRGTSSLSVRSRSFRASSTSSGWKSQTFLRKH